MIIAARWILPIARPPIEGGWIEIAAGHIVHVGAGAAPAGAHDLGDVAVLPGLVNAHTHLELSSLAGVVPPAESFVGWVRAMLRARQAEAESSASHRAVAAQRAADAMRATGTVLVGDISNTLTTFEPLRRAGIGGVVCHELLGFAHPDPAGLVRDASSRLGEAEGPQPAASAPALGGILCAHAPYSVSPALFTQIARRHPGGPLPVHLGESPEEIEFLMTGRGPLRDLLKELGAWTDGWRVPACDPVTYLKQVEYLQPGVLAVHGVHLTDAGLEQLRDAGATIVTCPRSNVWVGVGLPRVAHFYATGVPVAIGTDSLASVGSLNLFDELAELRRITPDVAAASLLESATRIGAEALGFGATHGTLTPGKHAALTTVSVPADVNDVEEYLVSGVPASAVRPLL